MAMTESGLKAAIKSQMESKFGPAFSAEPSGEADKYIEALATAIVHYIKATAETSPNDGPGHTHQIL